MDPEKIIAEWKSQFGGGMVGFDTAYFDALDDGKSRAQACSDGVDALLKEFVPFYESRRES